MLYSVFILVALAIVFNWLYKKDDDIKTAVSIIIPVAILTLSIIGLGQGAGRVVYILYYSFLIASALTKLLINTFILKRLFKDKYNEKTQKFSAKITLISYYVDALFTIVACCFVWVKITYIIIAIAFLLILIMVHELGHYTFGKILGFKINEFSIGFGPAILQKTKADGEKISLRVFPLGGYCAFEGEDEEVDKEGAFNSQKPWKRLIVLFGGVFFNFLFGIITSVAYLSMASYSLPEVIQLSDGNTNPFMAGDVIVAVEDNKLNYYRVSSDCFEQFSKLTAKYEAGEEFIVTVLRQGEEVDLTVKKEIRPASRYVTNIDGLKDKLYLQNADETYTLIEAQDVYAYVKDMTNPLDNLYKQVEENGVTAYKLYEKAEVLKLGGITESTAGASLGILQTYHYYEYSFGQALLYAVPFGLDVCWLILKVLGGIFTGATAVSDLGGTVTSVDQIAVLAQVDLRYLVYLLPMIAMNLAVFNILPIPALDGARMVFVLIEMIRKKPINRNIEGYIHAIGLLVLLALVVFLDVYHFII